MNLTHQVAKHPARKLAWLVAILSGVAVFICDLTLLRIFSYSVQNDIRNCLHLGMPLASLPYPLLNELRNSAYNPAAIILFQIVCAALAIAALILILARINLALATITAVLFVLDVTWSAANLTV